jgi:hypothetical protein
MQLLTQIGLIFLISTSASSVRRSTTPSTGVTALKIEEILRAKSLEIVDFSTCQRVRRARTSLLVLIHPS